MLTLPFHRHFLSLLLLCCCLSLASCTTTKPLSQEQMEKPRSYQEQVSMNGKISIQYQQNDKTEVLTGNFEWQQNTQELVITLISPVGQTIAIIRETPQGASLQQTKQEIRYAQDVEQLLMESLGWSLPISGLRDWLQGFDHSAAGHRTMVPTRDRQRIMSQGWQIDFNSWQEDQQQVHPRVIDVYRHTDEVGDLKIRIVVLEWMPSIPGN